MKFSITKKTESEKPESGSEMPQVKKQYSTRAMGLGGGFACVVVGFAMFLIYFFTLNMVIGAPGALFFIGGIILIYYYKGKAEDIQRQYVGAVSKEQKNALCIHPSKILFENLVNPEGFPQECENDHKFYFVYIWDLVKRRLVPFVLPDQQYFDPEVFAQRVLELPAHRRIFARKPKLFQKLKTALLVVAICIMFVLILTTTGGD